VELSGSIDEVGLDGRSLDTPGKSGRPSYETAGQICRPYRLGRIYWRDVMNVETGMWGLYDVGRI